MNIKEHFYLRKLTGDSKFYVYAYLDPRRQGCFSYENIVFDYEPFYIGEGSNSRVREHLGKDKRNKVKSAIIKEIFDNGMQPIIQIISSAITEAHAQNLERKIITMIGRIDRKTGPLTNLTSGGQGASNPSKEVREKMSNSRKGKIHSQESKDKISKNHIDVSGSGNPFYGKNHSVESKLKMSVSNLGKKASDETKEKLSKLKQGELHPAYGKKWTDDQIANSKASKIVLQYTLDGDFVEEWISIGKITKVLGYNHSCISRCCRGERENSYGYVWKFK